MTAPSTYVCPQCGPAPEGRDAHTERMHVWHPGDGLGQAALNSAADDLEQLDTLPAVGDPRDWQGAVVQWLRDRAARIGRGEAP